MIQNQISNHDISFIIALNSLLLHYPWHYCHELSSYTVFFYHQSIMSRFPYYIIFNNYTSKTWVWSVQFLGGCSPISHGDILSILTGTSCSLDLNAHFPSNEFIFNELVGFQYLIKKYISNIEHSLYCSSVYTLPIHAGY